MDLAGLDLEAALCEENGRPIESGHIITCHTPTKDLDKTKRFIQLQEIALKMMSMSGVADVANHQPLPGCL
jgi:hypothetical protein